MKSTTLLVGAAACTAMCAATLANADIYGDLSSFERDYDIVYTNSFDAIAPGLSGEQAYSNGVYSYTLTPISADGVSAPAGQLFNFDGYISTESGLDAILITFTGADVYAVGGNLWAVDDDGTNTGGYLTIESDDGQSQIFSSTGPDNFRGVSSDAPIRTLFVEMPGNDLWVALDNLVIGAVPTPGTLGLLGVSGLLMRRRR